jgi:NADH dehydrogenase
MQTISWRRGADLALRLIAAAILFQTLYFKFTGAPESVHIFSTLHMEPWGRIGAGVSELVAGVLLLAPRTVVFGALLSLSVISGAIASHVLFLGIEVMGDGGQLFALAVVVFVACSAVLTLRRTELPYLGRRFAKRCERGPDSIAAQTACRHSSHHDGPRRKRVLILGGGFGGVYTALELDHLLRWSDDVEVTLVNRENYFLFTPMLHEVAASDLDVTNIVSPIRKMLRRVDFFEGDAVALDLDAQRATLRHGSDGHTHEVEYDALVLSLGSVTNFFGLPGLAERAHTMKSLGDALRLRNRLIGHLEEADTECARDEREPLLTFVVAGGGFSGVETIAGMNDFLRAALPLYPRLDSSDLRVILVHPGEVVLPELGPDLGAYTQRKLIERGVDVRTGVKVARVDDGTVTLSDGEVLRSRTLVWTAGTSPHPMLSRLDVAKERGRVAVDERLAVAGRAGVFALGDCAAVPDVAGGGGHCPPTAQHALRQARVAARNVLAAVRGQRSRARFRFKTLGQLAAIGHRTGVARVLGVNFSGFVAWFLWRTIYLSKLPRFEKKLRVMLDWTLDLVFSKDLVQFLDAPAAMPGDPGRTLGHTHATDTVTGVDTRPTEEWRSHGVARKLHAGGL